MKSYSDAPTTGHPFDAHPNSRPRPLLIRDHVDGPCIVFRDGQMHWLTLWERVSLMLGKIDAFEIERRRRPNLLRALRETP